MSRLAMWLLALAGMIAGTWFVAWWMVPVVAAAWALADRGDAAVPLKAALAGLMAWGLLLLAQLPGGGVERLADALGQAIGVGAMPLVVLTLAFPALLAGSAAAIVRAVVGRAATRSDESAR